MSNSTGNATANTTMAAANTTKPVPVARQTGVIVHSAETLNLNTEGWTAPVAEHKVWWSPEERNSVILTLGVIFGAIMVVFLLWMFCTKEEFPCGSAKSGTEEEADEELDL